jgi:hypothetical protein
VSEVVRAPWTPEQVDALEKRQIRADRHPYTCGEHSSLPLVPTRLGWMCWKPGCSYRQDWAHAADMDTQP